jgi:hypothetical protein
MSNHGVRANFSPVIQKPLGYTPASSVDISALDARVTVNEAELDILDNGKIGLALDGGGAVLTTGLKGYLSIPYSGVIDSWRIIADQSGSVVVDVWNASYANYPPVDGDSITAAAPPTLTSAIKDESSTLTGWSTTVSDGDIMGFSVDSASLVTWINLSLFITKS